MTLPKKKRPERGEEMDAFLARAGWGGAKRRKLAGDASFRHYERVEGGYGRAVLMDAPPPWEDVRPFIDITARLEKCGLTVPRILAKDETEGFLLLEDLGDALFTQLLKKHPEREGELYVAAVEALIKIVQASKQHAAQFACEMKPYDMEVYLREVGLFAEWFLPQVVGMERAKKLRGEYLALWRGVITSASLQQSTLVHRDYHADNLFWLEGQKGYRAVGMLDYQDALWGDPAYDLVSLLEDARRDVAPQTVCDCIAQFASGTGEDTSAFAARYAVLGAQRNAKIIGIFTRLCVRDGKERFLDYLPRVWAHFMHDLSHPPLAPIHAFVETHVPQAWRGKFKADAGIGGIA